LVCDSIISRDSLPYPRRPQALSSAGLTTAPIICQVVVDPQHDAFRDPSKFIGPVYGAKEATALSQSLGWVMKPDGEYFRRVVPSPPPVE